MYEVFAPANITKEQAADKARKWLAKGPFGYTDVDAIQIEAIVAYFVPFVSITCQWTANWWGSIGNVDRGALGNARNTYSMAKASYDRVSREDQYRYDRPQEPREEDFVLWSDGSGTVGGKTDANRIFAANVVGKGLPDDFRAWSIKVCEKLRLASADLVTKDDPCLYASLDFHSIQVLPVFSAEDICGSLAPLVNKQIGKAVDRAMPKYSSGINFDGVSFNGPNAAWQATEALTLPVYLIRYKVPKGTYSFLMDGITGAVCVGERAKDFSGFFARLRASCGNIFGLKKRTPGLSVAPSSLEATGRWFGVGGRQVASFGLVAGICALIGLISVSTRTTPRADNSRLAITQDRSTTTAGSSVSPQSNLPLVTAVSVQPSVGIMVQPAPPPAQPQPTNLAAKLTAASAIAALPPAAQTSGNSRPTAIEREQIDIGGHAGDNAPVIRKDGIGGARASMQIRMDMDRELKSCSDQYLTYPGNDPDQAGYSSCVAYARENFKVPTTPTAYANCQTGEMVGFFNQTPRFYAGQILHPLGETQTSRAVGNLYIEHVFYFQGLRVDSSEASGAAVDGAIFRKLCPTSFIAAPTSQPPVITFKQNCLDNLVEAKRIANAALVASSARLSISRAWNVRNEGTDWMAAKCSADVILSNKQQARLDFSEAPRNGKYIVEAKVSSIGAKAP